MLNDPRTHGLWEASAPAAPATLPLDGRAEAHVVIVGGGYTGLSCALHLAEAGMSAVLLEAHDFGFGGAGRNVGLINAGLWLMPDDVPAAVGQTHGERLLEALGDGPALVMSLIDRHGIDCELERNGTLHCAVGEAGLQELRQREVQWLRRGAPVSLLDARETADRVGSRAYAGALLDQRAGTLQPLAYARGLARAALVAGARLYTQSTVIAAERCGPLNIRTAGAASGTMAGGGLMPTAADHGRAQQARVRLPSSISPLRLDAAALAFIRPARRACGIKTILSSFRLDRAGIRLGGRAAQRRHACAQGLGTTPWRACFSNSRDRLRT